MELERGGVYEHDDHGDVVVTNIVKSYTSYDVDRDEGDLEDVKIQFSNDWDSYGAMPSSVRTEDANTFVNSIGDQIRTITF